MSLRDRAVVVIVSAIAMVVTACVGDEPSTNSTEESDAAIDGATDAATPTDAGSDSSGNPCDAGSSFCSGTCVDTTSNPLRCGACANTCNGGDLGAEIEGGVPPVDCENSGCLIRYGNLDPFNGNSSCDANVLIAYQVTIGSSGTLRRLGAYSVFAIGKMQMGLYDATGSGGAPNKLIASTFAVSLVAAPMELATTTNPAVANGTYWIVLLFDTANTKLFQSTTIEHNYFVSSAFAFGTAFPTVFPSPIPENNGLDLNIYAVVD